MLMIPCTGAFKKVPFRAHHFLKNALALGADDSEDLSQVIETLKDKDVAFNFCAILNELLQPDAATGVIGHWASNRILGFRMVRIKDAAASQDETLDIIRFLVLYMHNEIEGNHSLGFQIMEAMAAQVVKMCAN